MTESNENVVDVEFRKPSLLSRVASAPMRISRRFPKTTTAFAAFGAVVAVGLTASAVSQVTNDRDENETDRATDVPDASADVS